MRTCVAMVRRRSKSRHWQASRMCMFASKKLGSLDLTDPQPPAYPKGNMACQWQLHHMEVRATKKSASHQ